MKLVHIDFRNLLAHAVMWLLRKTMKRPVTTSGSISMYVIMSDTIIENGLMPMGACDINANCEKFKKCKCVGVMNHEKTYAAIVGGEDRAGDDYNVTLVL